MYVDRIIPRVHETPPPTIRPKRRPSPRDSPSLRATSEDSTLSAPCIPSDTTNILTEIIPESVYDDEDDSQSGDVHPLRSTYGHLTGQKLGDADPVKIPPVISTHPPTKSKPTPPTFDATRVMTYQPPTLQVVKVPRRRSPGVVSVRRIRSPLERRISLENPSVSIVSSFLLPTIPPEPRIPLSFLGKENLQVQFSETDATDLDMKLCVLEWQSPITNSPSDISRLWALPRLVKLGVLFSQKKLDALIRGDMSNTVVDRAFVSGSQSLGILLSTDVSHTPAMVLFCARRTQTAMEDLADLFASEDHWAKVQIAAMVTSTCILLQIPQTGILYTQKGCDFIKTGNLRFAPICGRPPEFSEDLHENLASLSQTIYWANYMFLMRGGPEPQHAIIELEKEFRQELPVGEITSISLYIELISSYSKLTHSSSRSVP